MATSRELHNFYRSREWISFRLALIAERGPVCSECHCLVTNSRDLIGHHQTELTPENVHDRNVSLNPNKVSLICRTCHDKEHQRFGYENHGREVYVVYGPPLSGKTTYVQQMKSRYDIVIDMNLLFAGITGLPEYDKPDALLPVVRQVHSQLLDQVKTRFGKWSNAWIVGGYADKHRRERLVTELGAIPVHCDVTMDECLSRLGADPRLVHRRVEYDGYIRDWFERFRA